MTCHVCTKPLYYHGDPRWEPEARVTIRRDDYKLGDQEFYVHVTCLKKLLNET